MKDHGKNTIIMYMKSIIVNKSTFCSLVLLVNNLVIKKSSKWNLNISEVKLFKTKSI